MNQGFRAQISALLSQMPVYEEIAPSFAPHLPYESRYRALLQLTKLMPQWEEYRSDDSLVRGCQSKAWLWAFQSESGAFCIAGDSESKLVRSLLVLMILRVRGMGGAEIAQFDFEKWLEGLKLERHLSSSRMGGLGALIGRLKALALEL